MFKEKILLFLIAETPIHAGSGTEVGIVDLPIQREVHTKIPIIRGSSIKGAFRDYYEERARINSSSAEEEKEKTASQFLKEIFGPSPEELKGQEEKGKGFAAAASFMEARVLLFPVKSFKNIFAYITSPMVLKKFVQDLKWTGMEVKELEKLVEEMGEIEGFKALASKEMISDGEVILEEHKFEVIKDSSVLGELLSRMIFGNEDRDFRREKVRKHLVVLSDEDFEFFTTHFTEVVARIKISKDTGTVEKGGLWYEENLPSETILYEIVLFSDSRNPEKKAAAEEIKTAFENFRPKILQLGGNETVGRGYFSIYQYQGGEK